MKKQSSNKHAPTPKEKVMFLTRVLYEKKTLKEVYNLKFIILGLLRITDGVRLG